MVLGIIITLIGAISAIVGAVVDAGKAVLDILISIFQTIFSLFQSFVQSAPTPMKVAVFLFFILTFGNAFSTFFLGTRYACDGNNVLYQTSNIGTALTGVFKINFQGMSEGDKTTFLQNNYDVSELSASPTNIRCVDAKPRLLFYSINLLSYGLWMLMLILMFGVPMILGYYRDMGVLGR